MAETQIVAGREQNKYYPYSDLFYVNRHSFWEAGQDSYSLPPAQHQDMFTQLLNVEPVTQGVLQRRRGYSLFSTQNPAAPFTRAYSYRNENQNLRYLIWNNPFQVVVTDENGVGLITNNPGTPILFAPSPGSYVPRMVLSRDFGYFADGVAADYKKWDGTGNALNLTNWGIAVGATPASTFGPNNGGSASSAGYPNQSAPAHWSNVSNIIGAPDGNYASVTLNFNAPLQNSDRLTIGNFGLSIPGGTGPVTGIQVSFKGFYSGSITPGTNTSGNGVALQKNGVAVGFGHFTTFGTTNAFVTVGGNNDLWNTTWLPTDFTNSVFSISFSATAHLNGDAYTLNLDAVQVTVFFAGGTTAFTTNTSTTNIVLLSGRTYFTAFENSQTLTVSDLSQASVSTGPLPGSQVNITNIPVSSDPQVDTVLLLATADGNDQTTLYLLGTVANGVTTFTDTISDTVLLTRPLYQQTDTQGVVHGLANNKVPPTANFPTKHKGRIYMALGHNLYFSKNLDEVTTSTGTITSKWEEAWPATNAIDISEQAETVKALMSDGETLWIATERNIRRLIGDGPQNFQKPEVQFNECGVVSPEVWKVVFYEGQPVGTMWLTPDLRVMASDFNTYQDIGTPIQDVLNSITPTAINAAHAAFVSQAAFDLYMLYLPVNNSTVPNIVAIFNLRTKKWCIWQPTDTITASLFNINASGLPQWLFAAAAGSLFFWDGNVNTDRTGVAPSGTLQTLTLTNGGSGYSTPPLVIFSGGGGSGASAVVTGLSLGVVTQVAITSGGIGYSSAPTFSFAGGGGTGGGGTSTIALVPNTTTYAVTIQTSWLDFGDYNIRKFVNQIIPTTADNNGLTIQVDAASNEQDFNNPLSVVGPTVVIPASIPNDVFVPLASGPSHSRAFRFTFNSPNGIIQNVLTGYAIEAGVFHRY